MANEITISAIQGLTVTVQLYKDGLAVGAPFAASEIGTTGEYVASMPALTPYGQYLLVAFTGADKLASGEMLWSGDYEITVALAMLRGLDPNNPATQTLSNLTSGNIDIEVTGDLSDTTIFTAQP
jgi:hypothetical protein